jgi:hypothetical protein
MRLVESGLQRRNLTHPLHEIKMVSLVDMAQSEARSVDDANAEASGRILCNSNAVASSTSLNFDCTV